MAAYSEPVTKSGNREGCDRTDIQCINILGCMACLLSLLSVWLVQAC